MSRVVLVVAVVLLGAGRALARLEGPLSPSESSAGPQSVFHLSSQVDACLVAVQKTVSLIVHLHDAYKYVF